MEAWLEVVPMQEGGAGEELEWGCQLGIGRARKGRGMLCLSFFVFVFLESPFSKITLPQAHVIKLGISVGKEVTVLRELKANVFHLQ